MTDKPTWAKVHSGLINDPDHMNTLGVRLWYFLWLIDHADWEVGIVRDYTDQQAATSMKRPLSTVRKWRQGIEEAGYISSQAGFQCQHLAIHKWRNPREVSPPQQNVPGKPDTWPEMWKVVPAVMVSKNGKDASKVDTHPLGEVGTPSSESDSESQLGATPQQNVPGKPDKPRDLLFEAVLKGSWNVTYHPGMNLPKDTAGRVNKICKALREIEPPATGPEMVAYYGWWKVENPTLSAMRSHTDLPLSVLAFREKNQPIKAPDTPGTYRPTDAEREEGRKILEAFAAQRNEELQRERPDLKPA